MPKTRNRNGGGRKRVHTSSSVDNRKKYLKLVLKLSGDLFLLSQHMSVLDDQYLNRGNLSHATKVLKMAVSPPWLSIIGNIFSNYPKSRILKYIFKKCYFQNVLRSKSRKKKIMIYCMILNKKKRKKKIGSSGKKIALCYFLLVKCK